MNDATASLQDPCMTHATLRRSLLLLGLLALFSLTACGTDSNALPTNTDATLGAVKASVGGDGSSLLAQGEGEEGQTVTLRSSDSGAVIGTTTVSDEGRWSLQV